MQEKTTEKSIDLTLVKEKGCVNLPEIPFSPLSLKTVYKLDIYMIDEYVPFLGKVLCWNSELG